MKLHIYILQFIFAVFMIFIFPVYVVMSGTIWKTDIEKAATVHIEIYKFKFIPQETTIKAGTTIRWTNKEKRQYHSVWFEQLGELEPEYFFPGEFYQRTFKNTGSFPYRCGPHPKMTGVVHVN